MVRLWFEYGMILLIYVESLESNPSPWSSLLLLVSISSRAGIAIPLSSLAAAEGIPPLLTHTSLVLHNWHRLDPSGPIRTENLACNCRFLGGLDETWFYISTVEIEARGGGVFGALLQVRSF